MTTKEKADALVEDFFGEISHAITSVEYTIEVLQNVMFKTAESAREIDYAILEQTEILNELKSRI